MFIYVIGSARGPKKVGSARSLNSRLRQLQTGHHQKLAVEFSIVVPDDIANQVERRAHFLLSSHRAEGEWFRVGKRVAAAAVKQAADENGQGELAKGFGVGRPSMNLTPVLVRLRKGIPERIDAMVGKQKRAEFIRDAVERELERREREGEKE